MASFLNTANLNPAFQEDLSAVDNEYFNFSQTENDVDISSTSSSSGENSDSECDTDSVCELPQNYLNEAECSEADRAEKAKVSEFLRKGCSCKLGPNKDSCSRKLSEDQLLNSRASCLELSLSELDMVILAQLQANTQSNEGNSGKRSKISYSYHGKASNRKNVVGSQKRGNLTLTLFRGNHRDASVKYLFGRSKTSYDFRIL